MAKVYFDAQAHKPEDVIETFEPQFIM